MKLNLPTQASLFETGQNHSGFVAQTRYGLTQFATQFVKGRAAQVFHFDIFQVVPDTFVGIQVRGIAGQAFQMDAPGGTLFQKVLDGLTVMGGQTIPDDEQRTRNAAQQVPQKAHNGGSLEGAVLDHQIQFPIGRDRADGRQVIAGQGHAQQGRLASGRIRPYPRWQQVEARFVDKD